MLYTNDFAEHIRDTEVVMYADDVQFLHSGLSADIAELKARVKVTLSEAQSWFADNSLKINPTKTEIVLFSTRQRRLCVDFSVDLNGAIVRASPKAKVLGIVVDEHLSWNAQVSLVVKRCYATLYGLSKFCCGLSQEVKTLLMEALIFPHILYCLSVWGGCGITQRRRIQRVINHCARIVFCSRKSQHVSPLLALLDWPTIDDLLVKRDVSFVNRLMCHPCAPSPLREAFVHRHEVSSRGTRSTSAGLLQLHRVHTELAKRFFAYRAAAEWNAAHR